MISLKALGLGAALLAGLGVSGFGAMMFMAAGFSSNPSESNKVANQGCLVVGGGLIVAALSIAGLIAG